MRTAERVVLAVLVCGAAALVLVVGRTYLATNVGLSVVIVDPNLPPQPLALDLTVPLEGRMNDAMPIALTIVLEDGRSIERAEMLSAAGTVAVRDPSILLPDGALLTVSMKTAQHLRRTVEARMFNGVCALSLADPATYQELPANLLRGRMMLAAGDLTGTGALNDNVVDTADLGQWITEFRTASANAAADLSADGRVGAEDLSLIVRNFPRRGDPLP